MLNRLLGIVKEIRANPLKTDGHTCYPSTAGAYSSLVTNLVIEIGVYGDKAIQDRVEEVLKRHLGYNKESS